MQARGRAPAISECQDDLVKYAKKRGIPLDSPWRDLDDAQRALGARRRAGVGELGQVVARHVVRRAALLRVARDQGVQDAHPRAAVEVPRLHAVPLRRRRLKPERCVALGQADAMPSLRLRFAAA